MESIKASDLRIGNCLVDHTGILNIVKAIGVGVVKFIDDEACAFDLTKPIRLDPEMLLKAGFRELGREDDDLYYKLDIGFVLGTLVSITGNIEDGEFKCHGLATLKYLHQLQNLYHSLVGHELTINL